MNWKAQNLQSRTRRRVDSEALLNHHVQILYVLGSIIQRAILSHEFNIHVEISNMNEIQCCWIQPNYPHFKTVVLSLVHRPLYECVMHAKSSGSEL